MSPLLCKALILYCDCLEDGHSKIKFTFMSSVYLFKVLPGILKPLSYCEQTQEHYILLFSVCDLEF